MTKKKSKQNRKVHTKLTVKKRKIKISSVKTLHKKSKKSKSKKTTAVAFIPEPWSKVTKYKKIRNDSYGGYW